MQTYAQGVEAGALVHWREDEPFSIDVHGFSQHSAVCAVRYALRHEIGNFMSADLKIITGLGRHSTDGAPLLRPSGWKPEPPRGLCRSTGPGSPPGGSRGAAARF